MTPTNNLTLRPIDRKALVNRMLIGGGIALIAICTFVIPALKNPHPDWEKFWMLRPLIITPLVGAIAGLCVYFTNYVLYQKGWQKTLAIVLSVIGSVIALWLGIVLGLAGTMWH
jgi:hypothetical protein